MKGSKVRKRLRRLNFAKELGVWMEEKWERQPENDRVMGIPQL